MCSTTAPDKQVISTTARRTGPKFRMLVVNRLSNVPTYDYCTAVTVELLFPSFSVSFVCSVMPILKILRRNMNTAMNYW